MSAQDRPGLSLTLPPNFTFHYVEERPSTPESQEPEARPNPPPAPRTRGRKSRPAMVLTSPTGLRSAFQFFQDVPIPSIEVEDNSTQTGPKAASPFSLNERLNNRFLTPESQTGPIAPTQRAVTPLHRIITTPGDGAMNDRWALKAGEGIVRSGSVCSDSSDSSFASSSSFMSAGGSCTSPEDNESFYFPEGASNGLYSEGAKTDSTPAKVRKMHSVRQKRTRDGKSKDVAWTASMDSHLWSTFVLYQNDPTVTPFTVRSGAAPPLGVCHRVARAAKTSWKGARWSLGLIPEVEGNSRLRNVHDEANAVPAEVSRSSSSTPTAPNVASKLSVKWPYSESATRKRLRHLCRTKYSPSANKQQKLQRRSPAAFGRSRRLASPFTGSPGPSFSTRDMHISLSTSTSATMQPGNALANLAQSGHGPYVSSQLPGRRPDRYNEELDFNRSLGRSNGSGLNPYPAFEGGDRYEYKAEQANRGLGLRLGSPFHERPVTPPNQFIARFAAREVSPRPRSDTIPHPQEGLGVQGLQPGPRLASPAHLTEPLPLPTALKRRAQHQLEDELSPTGTSQFAAELFGAPAETSHRRVRSRGFSLGDVTRGSRSVANLITPPTDEWDFDMDSPESSNHSQPYATRHIPSGAPETFPRSTLADGPRRLGSPFEGKDSLMGNDEDRGRPRQTSPRLIWDSIGQRIGTELGADLYDASRKRMRG
jgi:hypothetical protein